MKADKVDTAFIAASCSFAFVLTAAWYVAIAEGIAVPPLAALNVYQSYLPNLLEAASFVFLTSCFFNPYF